MNYLPKAPCEEWLHEAFKKQRFLHDPQSIQKALFRLQNWPPHQAKPLALQGFVKQKVLQQATEY